MSATCLIHEKDNGDIEVSLAGKTALCSRSADQRGFLFHHDQLLRLQEVGLLTGVRFSRVTKLVEAFRVGALDFTVEDWDGARDVYYAVLRKAPTRVVVSLPLRSYASS